MIIIINLTFLCPYDRLDLQEKYFYIADIKRTYRPLMQLITIGLRRRFVLFLQEDIQERVYVSENFPKYEEQYRQGSAWPSDQAAAQRAGRERRPDGRRHWTG